MIENVLPLTQYEICPSFFENTLFSWVIPLEWEWWFTLTISLLHLWAFNCFEMLFSQQILAQLINTNQKLSRQFIMINCIEHYDYKYYLTEWVCNAQLSFISISRMYFQPSKKYVSCLVRKAVLVLCYVIWLVIGPIIKKICDWWVIEITIFDRWLESHFSWSCNTLAALEGTKLPYMHTYHTITAYHILRDWYEMNLALKLSPNENYFTEELVGILWTEFKLFKVKFGLRFAFIQRFGGREGKNERF